MKLRTWIEGPTAGNGHGFVVFMLTVSLLCLWEREHSLSASTEIHLFTTHISEQSPRCTKQGTAYLSNKLLMLHDSILPIPNWVHFDSEIVVGFCMIFPTEGAKATCSTRAPTTIIPSSSLFSFVFHFFSSTFPPIGFCTHRHNARDY